MKSEQRLVDQEQSLVWAGELISNFKDRQIVLLSGDLGAGKTQWVQFFLQSLGLEPSPSPTYAVIHEISAQIHHVDLYRLKSESDIESVGFWDLFLGQKGLVFVEWPERLCADELPLDWDQITLEIKKGPRDDQRQVLVSAR